MRSSCILFHLFALVSFAVDVTYAISPAPIKDRQNDNGGENEVRYPSVSNKPTHNSHGRKLVPRRRRTKSAKHPKATKAKDNCSCDDETSSSNELTCVELADSMGMKISLRHRRLEPITLSVIVIFAAKAIATAVLAKAAGEGFGWVMNQVGITDKALTAEDVAKVSKMVAKVDKDIEFLRMEVAAGFATMRDEFDLTRAAISQTQLTSATTSVQAMFDTYKSYLGLFNFKPSAEDNEEVRNMVKTLQTKIISSDTGIRYHVHLIHNVLMGPGLFSGESLLSTYSRLAMQNSDCTYKYSKYMNDFLEYYISYQTIGLFLMVEAYNAFDSSTREVLQRDYYSDWRGMINLQMKWVNNISPMATFVEGPYNLGVISGRVTSLAIRGNQILALSVHGTLTIKSMDNQSARPLKELGNTFLSTFIGIHDTRNSGKVIVASSGSYQGKSVIKVGIFPTYRGSPLGDSPPYSQSHHSKGALGIDGIYALSYHLDKSTGFLYFLEIGGIRNPGMRTLTLSRVNTGRGGVNQYIERVAYLDFGGSWMLPMLQGKEHVWALGMVGRYSVIMYIKVEGYLKFARVYDLSTNKYVNDTPGGQDLTDLQVKTTDGVIKVKNDREVLTVSLDGEKTVIPVRVNTKPHSSAVSLGMNTYSSSNSGVMMQGGKSVRFNPNFEVEAFALDRANQMWVAGREVGKDTTSVYKVGKTREVDEIPTLQAVVDQYG